VWCNFFFNDPIGPPELGKKSDSYSQCCSESDPTQNVSLNDSGSDSATLFPTATKCQNKIASKRYRSYEDVLTDVLLDYILESCTNCFRLDTQIFDRLDIKVFYSPVWISCNARLQFTNIFLQRFCVLGHTFPTTNAGWPIKCRQDADNRLVWFKTTLQDCLGVGAQKAIVTARSDQML